MAGRDFGTDAARALVKRAIEQLEKATSAEIVVAIRPNSGSYRHSDYLVGFGLSSVSLLVFIFHPRVMRSDVFPIEHFCAFIIGTLVSSYLAPLRRALTSRRLMTANVERAAKAAFVDLEVSRTRARTGLLLYVSLFEREVCIVADHGVPQLETTFAAFRTTAQDAIRGADLEAFVTVLQSLEQPLQEALPRGSDDENELSDAVEPA